MAPQPWPYAVDFRGFWACPCQAEWIPVYEAELQRRGLLTGPIHIYQLIGGNPSSGGTHLGGGESDFLDIPGDHDVAVWVARQMGADATWHRLVNWDGAGGIEHDHCGLTGCPHGAPYAGYQLTAVRAGFNGLGHLGEGGPDTGPRPLSGRTWQEGITWALAQGDDMPYTKAELTAIIQAAVPTAEEVAAAILAAPIDKAGDTVKKALRVSSGLPPAETP